MAEAFSVTSFKNDLFFVDLAAGNSKKNFKFYYWQPYNLQYMYISNFAHHRQLCFSHWNLCVVCCFFSFIDCQNLFGIIYRCPQEMKETLLMFRLVGDDVNKSEWLQKLTTGLANTTCTADTVTYLSHPALNCLGSWNLNVMLLPFRRIFWPQLTHRSWCCQKVTCQTGHSVELSGKGNHCLLEFAIWETHGW